MRLVLRFGTGSRGGGNDPGKDRGNRLDRFFDWDCGDLFEAGPDSGGDVNCPECKKLIAELKRLRKYVDRVTVKLLARDIKAIENRQKMEELSKDLKKVLPW